MRAKYADPEAQWIGTRSSELRDRGSKSIPQYQRIRTRCEPRRLAFRLAVSNRWSPMMVTIIVAAWIWRLTCREYNSGLRRRAGELAARPARPLAAKGQPPEMVAQAAQLGLAVFGENKVQEARAKIPLCPGRLRWHMIGHLQTNKCREAVGLFEMIQSVDSVHLAEELNKRAEQSGKRLPILLEINIAGEASKFGYRPETMLAELDRLNALPRLEIHGLMTVPPWTPEPEKVRPVFRRLRELKVECEQRLGAPMQHLSMGMTADYEVAIEEGATMVRIGTALFGERTRKKSE